MPPRLPALNQLADRLRGVQWSPRQTVGDSLAYLVTHREDLSRFEHSEDLGVAAYDEQSRDPPARAMAVHLMAVRNALLEELWHRHIFIGTEVIDELLFFSAKDQGTQDPLMATLAFLRDRRATRPGFVLFPLHSVGILGAGFLRGETKRRVQFVDRKNGVAITPQTNSLDQTIEFVERARRAFEVRKPADAELIRHWYRSRAAWLERNPLMVIRMTTQRGSYYDTEPVVLSRVRAAAARLAMVSTFQADGPSRPSVLFSTSRTNNWETLDIRHYIVFADDPASPTSLDGDCVPIHSRGSRIVELSDLSIEIDPEFGGRRTTMAQIDVAVALAYQGHLAHMWPRRRNAQTRTFDRFFSSLAFFLRSFHDGGSSWSAAISLSTAFEMLLTDSYRGGVTKRLTRRLGLVLRGVVGRQGYESAVRDLYAARGDLVHAGTSPAGLDLQTARQAFSRAFMVLTPRISDLPARTNEPARILTGDTPE